MKRHTFAICAYKESPYLEECIISLKEQSIKGNIIIVTSTPNRYIKDMAVKYDLPLFVNEGQRGITEDWNFAYRCAKERFYSDYITIAHQDDVYEKGYAAVVLCEAGKCAHPLLIFGDYYEIRNKRKVCSNRILRVKRAMLFPLRIRLLQNSRWVRRRVLSFGSPICCPSVTFVVRNLPDVIFENHYRACEDWEAWEKISRMRGAFIYIPKLVMGHRIHEASETTASIENNQRSREELEMFCKFWPSWIAKLLLKQYAKGQQSNRLD